MSQMHGSKTPSQMPDPQMAPNTDTLLLASKLDKVQKTLNDEAGEGKGINSCSRKSDDQDLGGETFFPDHRELEDVPSIKIDTYPEAALTKEFNPMEELKRIFPHQFKKMERSHWSSTWLFGLGFNVRTLFISVLAVPITYSALVGSPKPLQFPVQLVLLRLYMLIQDGLLNYCGNRLGWHSLTGKVRLHRPLSMLGIETLYLLPLMSAWYAWDGLTLFFPEIASWKPLWLFGRFCLEEFLTVHWCEILDEFLTDTPAYGKYLRQYLRSQDGKTETSRILFDRTFFHLAIGRWILCRFVSDAVGGYIQKISMLILCWDVTGFIWNLDLVAVPIRMGTWKSGANRENLTDKEQ